MSQVIASVSYNFVFSIPQEKLNFCYLLNRSNVMGDPPFFFCFLYMAAFMKATVLLYCIGTGTNVFASKV